MTKSLNQDLSTLKAMLSFRRPAGSITEEAYRLRFLVPLGVKEDPHGNLFIEVGKDEPQVLWSSHTDTVHTTAGMQNVAYDGHNLMLHTTSRSSCLGADDTAGNWLMIEMIKAGVPGLYVFHWGEEIGGVGSSALATKNPDFLKGIKVAIAFDRKGKTSIVTHQGGSLCCSEAFSKSLATQLPPGYKSDDGGSYTDTKEYRHLVPECTNISVGYEGAHTHKETLNLAHIVALRDALVVFDQSVLMIARDHTAKDPIPSWGRFFRSKSQTDLYGIEPDDDELYDLYDYDPAPKTTLQVMKDMVWKHPAAITDLLVAMGVSVADLESVVTAYAAYKPVVAPVVRTTPALPYTPPKKTQPGDAVRAAQAAKADMRAEKEEKHAADFAETVPTINPAPFASGINNTGRPKPATEASTSPAIIVGRPTVATLVH